MKPSDGRISRYGMLALAPSLDHVGIFARSVTDTAAMLQAIAGEDPRDPASLAVATDDYIHATAERAEPLRIALMPKAFDDRASEETRSAVAAAVARLVDAGAQIETVEEPSSFAYITANTMLELTAEAAEVHRERFAEKKDLYGPRFASSLSAVSIPLLCNISSRSRCSGAFAAMSTTCSRASTRS